MRRPFRRRKCWYCYRVGRFGWRRRDRVFAPVCRSDAKCFARADEARFPEDVPR